MVSLRRVANCPGVSESGPAPAGAAEETVLFGNDRLPRGRSNSLEVISGRCPAVRAAVTSRRIQLESFNSWVMGTMLDPQLQFISKKRQLALVARRNFVGITRISDDPGPDRHRAQVSCYIVIASFEQDRRERNGGVNLLAAGHVFLERIVQIEGVVVGKRDFGNVAVNDLDICRLEPCRRLAGNRRQVGALLDSGEAAVGKDGSDEAELAGAAADVENAGAGDGGEEFRRLGGDADGGSTGGPRAFESGPDRFGRTSRLRWTPEPGFRSRLLFAASNRVKQAVTEGKGRTRVLRERVRTARVAVGQHSRRQAQLNFVVRAGWLRRLMVIRLRRAVVCSTGLNQTERKSQ